MIFATSACDHTPVCAYPYGDISPEVRAEVAACGFAWACSTESKSIGSDVVDPYRLPRIGVGDWTIRDLETTLSNV